MTSMPHWPKYINQKKKYDLNDILYALDKLGNPHLKIPPVIHVAGTNGKGSTIAYMNSIFSHAGYKVHSYTSPHLINFNERIVIQGERISDEYLWEICEYTRFVVEKFSINLNFFEAITVASMIAFSEQKADILLLETGIGGRLDATNVIQAPLLTIITEISYDHMNYLGNSIIEIAREKAGIIKNGTLCIISAEVDSVYEEIFTKCDDMGVSYMAYSYDFGIKKLDEGFCVLGIGCDDFTFANPSLAGDHQIINAGTVIAGMSMLHKNKHFDLPNDVVSDAISRTIWPARLQKIKTYNDNIELWVDGAHNSSGAAALCDFIKQRFACKISLILGMTKNRNIFDFLLPLGDCIEHIFCVKVKSEPSSYSAQNLCQSIQNIGFACTECDSLDDAIAQSINCGKPIIVTGSLYLAADLLKTYDMLTG